MASQETKHINEDTSNAALTAAELAKNKITSIVGYGGETISVNQNGFLENPAQHLPSGLLDKMKDAWSSSNGDVNAFYSQSIDGKSVKDILSECPSQQSFGIAKELNLPDGTDVPCKEFTSHGYTAIKYGTNSSAANITPVDDAGNTVAPVSDGGTSGTDGAVDSGAGDGVTDGGAGTTGGSGDWWSFFGSKEFLIGAAVFAGVVAALKALGNTIKVRFRKCAKVLYNMQKDFGTAEDGMNMKAVLPGMGSKIMDKIGQLYGRKKGAGKEKGAIGLRPFVDNYRNEIAADFAEAQKAYNLIPASKVLNTGTSGANNNLTKNPNESVVYESFAAALNDGKLNEEEAVNEVALGTAVALGSLLMTGIRLVKGGFSFTREGKDGKPETKVVQATPHSIREICYSIINIFYGKYFNLEKVFTKLGINDLSEVDKSNVEKFKKIVEKSSEEIPAGAKNKMYTRVEKNYNDMIHSYTKIARTVVNNFEKFTKKQKGLDGKVKELSEKDSNLLVAATEKLRAELNRQEDAYINNFPRVMNAIISSPEYVKFTNFIIEKVLPVFTTGEAGDADYVLDIIPKQNDYFIVRQTNSQAGLDNDDTANGNVALCKIANVKDKTISFNLLGTIKPDVKLTRVGTQYDLSEFKNNEEYLDASSYDSSKTQELDYAKWLSLDPIQAKMSPNEQEDEKETRSKRYKRILDDKPEEIEVFTNDNDDEFMFIAPAGDNNESSSEEKSYEPDHALNEGGEEGENKSQEQGKELVVVDKTNGHYCYLTNVSDEQLNAYKESKNLTKQIESTEEKNNIIDNHVEPIDNASNDLKLGNDSNINVSLTDAKPIEPSVALEAVELLTSKPNSNDKQQVIAKIEQDNVKDIVPIKGVNTVVVGMTHDGYMLVLNPSTNKLLEVNTNNNNIVELDETKVQAIINSMKEMVSLKTSGKINDAGIELIRDENGVWKFISKANQIPQNTTTQQDQDNANISQKENNVSTSYSIEYSKLFNLAESFMGTLSFLKVHRNITINSDDVYYILSENAWGDGSLRNPVEYLKNHLNESDKFNTYNDFAKYAKSSTSINFVPSTDTEYKTSLPYNRYKMLTESNPLYESLVFVSFDNTEERKVKDVIKVQDIQKIVG